MRKNEQQSCTLPPGDELGKGFSSAVDISSMERIIVQAMIENGTDSTFRIQSDALVDTGAAYLTLPSAWRDWLGKLTRLDSVSVETATQAVVNDDICGPVLLRMGNFRPVLTEVLFIAMEPSDGHYEPLIG